MSIAVPNLFAPLDVGPMRLRNRIVVSGHGSKLQKGGRLTDGYIAYQAARAEGGAAMVTTEILMVDERARYNANSIVVTRDEVIPDFIRLAEAIHAHDSRIVGQLFHPGFELTGGDDGSSRVVYAPSNVPNERRKIVPRPMPETMIEEIVGLFGNGARRLEAAGVDGAEVVASHGYLPAQFLSEVTNRRTDRWGGDLENRLRFLREVARDIRAKTGPGFALGLRISGSDRGSDALNDDLVVDVCRTLDTDGVWDWFSVTLGASAEVGAAHDIIAPMGSAPNHAVPLAARVKAAVAAPVIVTGRINQPAAAEEIVALGQADLVGMVRALIADPEWPNKAQAGRAEDIRVCIACNQACIGHNHKGFAVSCIQNPVSGRELEFRGIAPASVPRRILVAGGGPAGMKAAVAAARRGHRVTLCEAAERLGGQVLLAQLLPGRSEFGGVSTNLVHEIGHLGLEVRLRTAVDRKLVAAEAPDAVIVATGATARRPAFEGDETVAALDAWQILAGGANVGGRVLIADWAADWTALGLAELLAREGRHVRVATSATTAGEMMPLYSRNHWLARLHGLGVEFLPYLRLYGADGDTVYLQHILSDAPVLAEGVDTLVLSYGQQPVDGLLAELDGLDVGIHGIGDCMAPRTAEEAILEGLRLGVSI